MGLSTARLYRRSVSGIYFIRVLLVYPTNADPGDGRTKTGRNKGEVKRSLRTADPKLAGKIVATINAVLANIPMSARAASYDQIHEQVLARFMGPQAQPNEIVDAADLTNFLNFFQDLAQPGLEEFQEVMLQRVRTRSITTMSPAITVRDEADKNLFIQLAQGVSQPGMEELKAALLDRLRGTPMVAAVPASASAYSPISAVRIDTASTHKHSAPESASKTAHLAAVPASEEIPVAAAQAMGGQPAVTAPSLEEDQDEVSPTDVGNPTVWADAMDAYIASLEVQNAVKRKTRNERRKLLSQLEDFMVSEFKFPRRFYVHQVRKFHISAFADHSAKRLARGVTKVELQAASDSGESLSTVKPGTLFKRNSSLGLFFTWAIDEREAAVADPTDALSKRNTTLKKQKAETREPYIPFTRNQIATIFEPVRYLTHFRVPDYFWAPLLGAHLGARLGELVKVALCNIKHHELSDIWYIDLQPEDTKNAISVRRLPITQPLIDLGFLEYVAKLRELGATQLFPHRDMTGDTAEDQPSKNASQAFAKFLDVCALSDPLLVFHSFRHTVITVLQLANVPLVISQQIVGHAAQDHAVETGRITREQARGDTMTTYTHANIPSMTMEDPFQHLKETLEKNLILPLDYPRLKLAADVVLEHLRKVPEAKTGFKAGWSILKKDYTKEMMARIG